LGATALRDAGNGLPSRSSDVSASASSKLRRDSLPAHLASLDKLRRLVRLDGESSNQLFSVLAEWNAILTDTSLTDDAPPPPAP